MSIEPEDRFTPPSPLCPHPDRWHSPDSDSTEVEVTALVAAFVTALQPDYVLETGTAWGQTAHAIGQALHANGQGRLDTLEIDPDRVEHSKNRCAGLPVTVHQVESLTFTPAGPIGFAWFDSLFPLRVPEFRRYYPQMVPGRTIVGFHDTAPHHGLRPSIDVLASLGVLRPIYLPTPRGVCFAEVA